MVIGKHWIWRCCVEITKRNMQYPSKPEQNSELVTPSLKGNEQAKQPWNSTDESVLWLICSASSVTENMKQVIICHSVTKRWSLVWCFQLHYRSVHLMLYFSIFAILSFIDLTCFSLSTCHVVIFTFSFVLSVMFHFGLPCCFCGHCCQSLFEFRCVNWYGHSFRVLLFLLQFPKNDSNGQTPWSLI